MSTTILQDLSRYVANEEARRKEEEDRKYEALIQKIEKMVYEELEGSVKEGYTYQDGTVYFSDVYNRLYDKVNDIDGASSPELVEAIGRIDGLGQEGTILKIEKTAQNPRLQAVLKAYNQYVSEIETLADGYFKEMLQTLAKAMREKTLTINSAGKVEFTFACPEETVQIIRKKFNAEGYKANISYKKEQGNNQIAWEIWHEE